MRTLVHLSNLRIGRCPKEKLTQLEAWLDRLQPSLIAVSGNLTATGSEYQLEQARYFLSLLPSPQLVVPGDADVPKWDPLARMLAPWENYERFFGKNRTPYFADNEMVVAGLRTALTMPLSRPNLRTDEKDFLHELMKTAEPGLVKVIVSHRPIFLPDKLEPNDEDGRVFRSQVDLFVTGHLWDERHPKGLRESDTTVFVGTRPKDPLGFQVLQIDRHHVDVNEYEWNATQKDFCLKETKNIPLNVLGRKSA